MQNLIILLLMLTAVMADIQQGTLLNNSFAMMNISLELRNISFTNTSQVFKSGSKKLPEDTPNTCNINTKLYKKYMGGKGVRKTDWTKKECSEPGCFYIYDQKNFGWSLPPHLKVKGFDYLTGCRYDIPYLIQRTHGSADKKLHKALKMLRACFAGDLGNATSFCQPEHQNATSALLDEERNHTWFGHHLPSFQTKCFYNFTSGVFFATEGNHHKRSLVVCCSDHGITDNKEFRGICEKATNVIKDVDKWRKQIDDNKPSDGHQQD